MSYCLDEDKESGNGNECKMENGSGQRHIGIERRREKKKETKEVGGKGSRKETRGTKT